MVNVRVLQDFQIWLRFNNGTEGVANLAPSLHGAMFAPLRDPSLFALARLDPELHTVAWSNGADRLSPATGRRVHPNKHILKSVAVSHGGP